jgi:hypothetical protein
MPSCAAAITPAASSQTSSACPHHADQLRLLVSPEQARPAPLAVDHEHDLRTLTGDRRPVCPKLQIVVCFSGCDLDQCRQQAVTAFDLSARSPPASRSLEQDHARADRGRRALVRHGSRPSSLARRRLIGELSHAGRTWARLQRVSDSLSRAPAPANCSSSRSVSFPVRLPFGASATMPRLRTLVFR